MARFVNGRKLLGIAFVGLAGLAGAMMIAQPPARPELTSGAANAAEAPAMQPEKAGLVADAKPVDERFVIKRILPIEGAIKYGEWHWDDSNVPDGPIVVTVDLDARVLSVFKGGYEIGAAPYCLARRKSRTLTASSR